MRRFGLVGYPLSHSFSAKYFANKFRVENIPGCRYDNFEAETLDGFKNRMNDIEGIEGLNVTIPYKEKILSLLDDQNDIVEAIQASNCIKITGNKWVGYNTDAIAFENSFKVQLEEHHKKALVLGTGGASKAVGYALKKIGLEALFVSNTKKGEGIIHYSGIGEEIMNSYTVIINTTPLGTFPNIENYPPLPYQCLTSSHYLYDLVYNPAKTAFLSIGEGYGAQVCNGYKMLEIQAEESWKIWNS